jgi:hypothetical protein
VRIDDLSYAASQSSIILGTVDYLAFTLTSIRLTVFDRIHGPGPPSVVSWKDGNI